MNCVRHAHGHGRARESIGNSSPRMPPLLVPPQLAGQLHAVRGVVNHRGARFAHDGQAAHVGHEVTPKPRCASQAMKWFDRPAS